jgi:hypothetical protein
MSNNEKHSNSGGRRHGKSSSAIRTPSAKPEPEYVDYILKMTFNPSMPGRVITHEDSSKYPVVIYDAYIPNTSLAKTAEATIRGVVYACPKDFDFGYTVHEEINEVTGSGFELIKETLYFKNLPGHPTLIGLAEEKCSGCIVPPNIDLKDVESMKAQACATPFEMFGNFQLNGTGIFKNVEGSGIGMCGVSTDFVVIHAALIKGWPL